MKSLLKLIRSIWLVALLVVSVLPMVASALSPVSALVSYDGQKQTRSAYDGALLSSFNYDSPSVPLAGGEEYRTVRTVGLFPSFAQFLAAEGGTATAYRAINPAFADATEASGQFYRSGAAGRLGNDGIYANSTIEGATAEFQFHNPGVDPVVFKVQYPTGPTLNISPPSGYFSSPLPFTGDANILTAPSLRAPGTLNLLIREGAVPAGRVP
jgi:hypothetical protein